MTEATSAPAHALVRCPFCLKLNRIDMARAAERPKCGSCGKPILLDRPVRVSDDDFDRVIAESEVPIIVDFYADWCGPCKVIAPALDEIARERTGQLLVVKLDTDASPKTATRHRITGLPTVAVFRNGREVARQTGAVPKKTLEALVDSAAA